MKKKFIIFIFINLLLLSCEKVKRGLGIEKDAPDEFLIEKRSGIMLPPNYDLVEPDKLSDNSKEKTESMKSILSKEIKESKNSDSQNKITNTNIENEVLNKIK